MMDRVSHNVGTVLIGVFAIVGLLGASLVITGWLRATAERARAAAARDRAVNAARQVQLALDNYERASRQSVSCEPLRIVTWNVESGGAEPAVIARQLIELGRHDIFALQEVNIRDAGRYGDAIRRGFSKSYRYFVSTTGRGDRLMIVFDSDRLELFEMREMFRYQGYALNDWQHRSPLVAEFADRRTGTRFLFVTVHLARGNEKLRNEQASGLREWARGQDLPIIAAGDFNFDYQFDTQSGNQAFDNFRQDAVWKWVVPDPLIDTNWSDPDGDGQDNYPDSILDFAWVTGSATSWQSECEVVVRDGDFPDDKATSDHRPVILRLSPVR